MTKRVSKSLDAHHKKGRLGHFYRTMEQEYAYKRTIFNEKTLPKQGGMVKKH